MYNHNLFSKKKKSYAVPLIILCLALGLLGFGFWMSQDNNSSKKAEITPQIDDKTITDNLAVNKEQSQNKEENLNLETMKEEVTEDEVLEEDEMVEQAAKPYYLIKEVDGLIKLFHYSAQGEEKVIRITGISYDLLSETDQNLFKTGVMKYSIEELNDLLQDFES